jgi:hypothetical protein
MNCRDVSIWMKSSWKSFVFDHGSWFEYTEETVSKNGKKWSSIMGFDSYRKTYYATKSQEGPWKWTEYFGKTN